MTEHWKNTWSNRYFTISFSAIKQLTLPGIQVKQKVCTVFIQRAGSLAYCVWSYKWKSVNKGAVIGAILHVMKLQFTKKYLTKAFGQFFQHYDFLKNKPSLNSSWVSQPVSEPPVNTSRIVVSSDGPIWTTKKPIWEPGGRPILSEVPPMPRESFLKR